MHVLEVVLFRLNPGVDEAEFLQAAEATFGLLQGYSGYIRRELSVDDSGQWVDVVWWTDKATAFAAAEQFMATPEAQQFEKMISAESTVMVHVTPKRVDG